MKRKFCLWFVSLVLLSLLVSCDEAAFSKSLDSTFFEYILRDTSEGDVVVTELDAYSREGYCYYHVRYSCTEDGERKEWDAVYRGRYNRVSLYYNLNWEDDSTVFPMKDAFYDAVEYGEHKRYGDEEITRYIEAYYRAK